MVGFLNSLHLQKIKNKMANKTYFHETWVSDNRFMELIVRSLSKENSQSKLLFMVRSLEILESSELYKILHYFI